MAEILFVKNEYITRTYSWHIEHKMTAAHLPFGWSSFLKQKQYRSFSACRKSTFCDHSEHIKKETVPLCARLINNSDVPA